MSWIFFLMLAMLFYWAASLVVSNMEIPLQKVIVFGFLVCLVSLYFMIVSAGFDGSTGLGGLTFWLGVALVMVGLLNKAE